MNHRYELEKYDGPQTRHTCPVCGQKGTFARYVDTITGEYLSPDAGRCNREDKCGYHYTPKQYFADHPRTDTDRPAARIPSRRIPPVSRSSEAEAKPIQYIPSTFVRKALGYNSAFVSFLCSLFDRYTLESPTVVRLMSEYYLGHTSSGAVIFWQIDRQMKVRTGKIMRYDPRTGKRIKSTGGAIDWVHSRLKRRGTLSADWELTQCLFGEHLLERRPHDTVCLVESEKSAIIGSGTMPGYVWVATGGKQNLKADKCQCLRGRDVIVFPDLGAFDQWEEQAGQIAAKVGFTLSVSDALERIASDTDRHDGLDIADYLIRQIQAAAEPARPSVTLTREEKMLRYLNSRNPAVSQLVHTFGLVSASTGEILRIDTC